MVRWIIHGQGYGVHPFITQLPSLGDFKPMPDIELGDIGLTMGLNSTDNGYAIFTGVHMREHVNALRQCFEGWLVHQIVQLQ